MRKCHVEVCEADSTTGCPGHEDDGPRFNKYPFWWQRRIVMEMQQEGMRPTLLVRCTPAVLFFLMQCSRSGRSLPPSSEPLALHPVEYKLLTHSPDAYAELRRAQAEHKGSRSASQIRADLDLIWGCDSPTGTGCTCRK